MSRFCPILHCYHLFPYHRSHHQQSCVHSLWAIFVDERKTLLWMNEACFHQCFGRLFINILSFMLNLQLPFHTWTSFRSSSVFWEEAQGWTKRSPNQAHEPFFHTCFCGSLACALSPSFVHFTQDLCIQEILAANIHKFALQARPLSVCCGAHTVGPGSQFNINSTSN